MHNRDRSNLNWSFSCLSVSYLTAKTILREIPLFVFNPSDAGGMHLSPAYSALFESTLIFHLTQKKDVFRTFLPLSDRTSLMRFYRTTLSASFTRRLLPVLTPFAGKTSFSDVMSTSLSLLKISHYESETCIGRF